MCVSSVWLIVDYLMKRLLRPISGSLILLALFCATWSVSAAGPIPSADLIHSASPAPTIGVGPGTEMSEECTIAVLTGKATRDGRPILWKNRDAGYLDNEVIFFTDGRYKSVALVNAGETDKAWIGLNERGFAITSGSARRSPARARAIRAISPRPVASR